MDSQNLNQSPIQEKIPGGAKKLSPLDLNAIKLDPKHTILTPEYLDNLVSHKETN